MNKINLTEIALKNKSILVFFVVSIMLAGIISYIQLGRMENPDFTIRQMVVTAAWPGATSEQIQELVLDKLERKLQETPWLDKLTSISRPGLAVIYVNLQETSPKKEVRHIWQEVRNLAAEATADMPSTVIGPFFDDRFDDIFGSIYAVTGDEFSYEEKREIAEKIRRRFLPLESVKRIELLGVQKEVIYVKVDPEKLAFLGLTAEQAGQAVMSQLAVVPSGMIRTGTGNLHIRLDSTYTNTKDIKRIPFNINGRTLFLGDIARVERAYHEPMEPAMYFNGKPAIGIAISMATGHNITTMGKDLDKIMQEIKPNIPLGIEIEPVADQPLIVADSVNEFFTSLVEAVVIILIVSFLSLGFRTGLVVSLCIPLVFAAVFVIMKFMGISLHIVSLGTLIIALGLLVDDEIIAVEMMSVKLEEGLDRFSAACAAYKITALPMLSGTLITCAGFIPIGFSRGGTAEFTSSIFPVLVSALFVSWIVSVTVTPYLGYLLIKEKKVEESYNTRFYKIFKNLLIKSLKYKKTVVGLTALTFALSISSFRFIEKEFFPPSKRGDLLIDLELMDGTSISTTDRIAGEFAKRIDKIEGLINYSYYVGSTAPRYVVTVSPEAPASNMAQFVLVAVNEQTRDKIQEELQIILDKEFSGVRSNIRSLSMGIPAPYPAMIKVKGADPSKVRDIAYEIAGIMNKNNNYYNINLSWNEKNRNITLKTDSARLSQLGISRNEIAAALNSFITGVYIGEFYQKDKKTGIIFKMPDIDVKDIDNIAIPTPGGKYIPLSNMADISYSYEDMTVKRENLVPSILVQAKTRTGTPNDTTQFIFDKTQEIRDNLPAGYSVSPAGNLEDSSKSTKYLLEPIPAMIFVIILILMFQLKKFSLTMLAMFTAPLGLIGVAFSMILLRQPMGFMAQLGIIALNGMIIRNSVILLDQIGKNIQAGHTPYISIINASVMRFRPIMLTTVTAILALIPLMLSNFWGPLAVSLSGGLFVGTVLTLIVLPCMYAIYFKVSKS